MEKKMIRELKGKAQSIQPTIRVGKSGMTEQVISEIAHQLSKNHLIKIKALGCDKNEVKLIASDLSQHTGSELIDVRGNTIVLWKG
ncbi:MAG: YhbY family RNA-binding protein [Thermoplasmata archaeon]|nr:YhbY family RNA-binding protein [Thermoplasmata archaeon]